MADTTTSTTMVGDTTPTNNMMQNGQEDEDMAAFSVNVREQRFYERPTPEVNQLVMVKVLRVADTSAYVQLLEYSHIEGMILFSEVSTRRIRSMLKEIRVGQFAVCLVLRVEKEKGYIDLSRRRVNAEERSTYLQTYAKSKLVHSTLRQLAATHKEKYTMRQLCERISWPLYKKYGHAIDAFKQYINDKDESIFGDLDVDEAVKKNMYQIIEKKLTPQAVKLKAKIEVSCFESAGIDAVKAALLSGLGDEAEQAADNKAVEEGGNKGKGLEMNRIQIKVVAPPHYEVSTQSVGKESGVKTIQAALDRIEAKIQEFKGNFVVKAKPEVLGEDDEVIDKDLDSEGDDSESSEEEEDQEGMGNFKLEGEE